MRKQLPGTLAAIIYFIVFPFIYILSLLPFWALYLVSDFLYVILFYLIGYRKKVVTDNLRNSFPQKTEKEIQKLVKTYYHYLCDLSLETFKTLTISRKNMLKHCSFTDETQALFDELAREHKSIILVMGHMGNWEWGGNTFSLQCKHQLYVIYHPIANKYFDGLMYRMRTRFGTRLIAMKNTFREMLSNRSGLNATAFIADQTPQPNNAHWMTFLNQDTPVFKGTEIIAKKLNTPIVYASIRKVKRGYYRVYAEILVADPASTSDNEITELHTRKLEQDIIARPETWLWSHRRWKHQRPVN